MLVVGDRDMENQTVSLRLRSGEDQGAMSLAGFEAIIAEDVRTQGDPVIKPKFDFIKAGPPAFQGACFCVYSVGSGW